VRRLVIETATSACSVALLEDERVIAADHQDVGRGHAEHLIGMIAALPDGGRADAVLVGCGPGSFTGVRVGIAAARGLGLGWGVPVFGFSTLALIAASALNADEASEIAVVIEGGHGELFAQSFSRTPEMAAGKLQSVPLAEAIDRVSAMRVAGNAAEKLVAARGHGTAISIAPCAADLIHLPPRFVQLAPTPIYGRGPDAKPMVS
jgi:tRNA threonylcarbamoyladenosine biosynthesis protein TsaB